MLAARTSVLILPSWCRLECSFTGGARAISDSVHNLIKQFGVVGFVLLFFFCLHRNSPFCTAPFLCIFFRFPSQRRLGMRSSNQIFIVIKFHFVIIYQSERDHLASAWFFDCMCNVRIWVNYWRLYVCVRLIGPQLTIVQAYEILLSWF